MSDHSHLHRPDSEELPLGLFTLRGAIRRPGTKSDRSIRTTSCEDAQVRVLSLMERQ